MNEIVNTKICSKCNKNLPISNFIVRPDNNKYYNSCKACKIQYNNKYYALNKEKIIRQNSDYVLKKREQNPLFRLESNLRRRLSFAKAACGKSKSHGTKKLLGCSWQDLKIYLESKFQRGMTWDNYGEWHIDHIRPCASFDLTNPEEQSKCFHYTNLQPLWAKDNLSKGKKYGTRN